MGLGLGSKAELRAFPRPLPSRSSATVVVSCTPCAVVRGILIDSMYEIP